MASRSGSPQASSSSSSKRVANRKDRDECDSNGSVTDTDTNPAVIDDTLPPDLKFHLTIFGFLRFSETTAWTSVFPYAYFLMRDMPEKPPLESVPFLASLVIASYTLMEFFGNIPFAYLSDRIGRRPVLLMGLTVNVLFMVWFGFARSVTMVIVLRSLQGLLNPNTGMITSCVAESIGTRKHLQAKGFTYVTLLRSAGLLVGPFIGGGLADPAKRWPSVFDTPFWTTYPYLLPNLTVAGLELVLLVVMIIGVPETNPALRGRKDIGLRFGETLARRFGWTRMITDSGAEEHSERARLLTNDGNRSSDEESTLNYGAAAGSSGTTTPRIEKRNRTYTPQVVMYVVLMILIGFHKTSSDVIIPSFLAIPRLPPAADSNPLHFSGGFGLDTNAVGNVLVAQAVIGCACQLAIPHVVKKLGALRAMRLSLVAYPLTYLITPFSVVLPEAFGIGLILVDLWVKISIVSLAYACHSILLTNTAPSMEAIARLNGATAAFGALARSVGPVIAGNVFEWGLRLGYVIIPFWLLAAVSGGATLLAPWLKDHPDEYDD